MKKHAIVKSDKKPRPVPLKSAYRKPAIVEEEVIKFSSLGTILPHGNPEGCD